MDSVIIKLKNDETDLSRLVRYLEDRDDSFNVPLSSRVDINAYAKKLLACGNVLAIVENDDIMAIIGYYVDKEKKTIFTSVYSAKKEIQLKGQSKDLAYVMCLRGKEEGLDKILLEVTDRRVMVLHRRMGATLLKEEAITSRTSAIMPVHVYGNPCDTKRIQEIADIYGLKIIYDAAHAFGVEVDGESVLNAGDPSTLSFHATKVYNTIEGGAMVMHDQQTKTRIDNLKNFGIVSETKVVAPGINSKMDELRSAYGLLNLKQVDGAIRKRREVALAYREAFKNVSGITYFEDILGVKHNYAYFPIFVDEEKYGVSRDDLYLKLREENIYGRRYFYPLISTFTTYRGLESANPKNIPNATRLSEQVLCLPIHHLLDENDVERVVKAIVK